MKFATTGRVVGDFYVLGFPEMPVYLLDGETPVLFDAPLACLAGLYEKAIREVLGDRPPAYLFLSHSHFDHLSAAAWLKRAFPEMKIAASPRVGEILQRPRAVETIRMLNRETCRDIQAKGLDKADGLVLDDFEPVTLDLALEPDQEVDLGNGRIVRAIPSPGHTRDFYAYWIEKEKILMASEAVGCENVNGYIMTEFLVDFDMYMESMARLKSFDAEVVTQGHHFVYTPPHAAPRIARAETRGREYAAMLERFLIEENGDEERVAARVKVEEFDTMPGPKQVESAYMLNTVARIRNIKARMEKRAAAAG